MGRYLLKRLCFALLLVFIVSSAALLLTRIAPGDYAAMQGVDLTAEQRESLRASLGLDRSFARQYASWLGGAVHLDFGRSLLYSRPVSTIVGERALNTAMLASAALLLRLWDAARSSPVLGSRLIATQTPSPPNRALAPPSSSYLIPMPSSTSLGNRPCGTVTT